MTDHDNDRGPGLRSDEPQRDPNRDSSRDSPREPQREPALAAAAAASAVPADTALVNEMARAYLKDRTRERRWRIFFRFAWLLVALGVLALILSQRGPAVASGPHTAVIDIRGTIANEAEASTENIIPSLRSAFEDPGSQAIVLRINSPGGSPVQSGIINDEIRRLKALHNKKVYAVVEEVCASGAYFIAVAADEIFVNKASIVGSIGVRMDGFGLTGLMDKLGVERRLLIAGENKGFLDPFSPLSASQKAYAQGMLDRIHTQFIDAVKLGRGDRLQEDRDVFSGLFWTGEQAVQMGLADNFGSVEQVAREVVKAEEIIDYTSRQNLAERLAKRFGAAVGEGAVKALRGFGPLQ